MAEISPTEVLQQIALAIPAEHHEHIIVVGSVAAAYHFSDDRTHRVRTKDIDFLLAPREKAEESGVKMATVLLEGGWKHRTDGGFGRPQPSPEPAENLSAIRLHPPDSKDRFLELLTVPESEKQSGKTWMPVKLGDGFYGLPSFEFLSLTAHKAKLTEFGIRYARPEMMALSNLLSHPSIGPERMSTPIGGRDIKRTNKDLGRVLALARLSGGVTEPWVDEWREALHVCFPSRRRDLARTAGSGLVELLASDDDLEEAHTTCVYGLLSGVPVTIDGLRATGERLVVDAIEPLAEWGAAGPSSITKST